VAHHLDEGGGGREPLDAAIFGRLAVARRGHHPRRADALDAHSQRHAGRLMTLDEVCAAVRETGAHGGDDRGIRGLEGDPAGTVARERGRSDHEQSDDEQPAHAIESPDPRRPFGEFV
jgi:hypothetical protein